MSTQASALWRDLLDRIEDRLAALVDRQQVLEVDGGEVTVQPYTPDAPARTLTKLTGAPVRPGDDALVLRAWGGGVVLGAFSNGAPDPPVVPHTHPMDPIDASAYSDINAAILAAGPGGQVWVPKQTTIDAPDPIRVLMGTRLVGEDRYTSVIAATGAAGAMTSDSATEISDVRMQNLTLSGGGVSPVGLDMRYLTYSDVDRLRIEGFTDHAVWMGGQQATDVGGWLNSLTRSRIIASPGGDALYLAGRVGASGPPTANGTMVMKNMLGGGYGANDVVVNIEAGEDNVFVGNDGGYGNQAGSIFWRLAGELARRNSFHSNRAENIGQTVSNTGRYNHFAHNTFVATDGTKHPAENATGALRNVYLDNYTSGGLTPGIADLVSGLQTQLLTPTGEITTTGAIRTSWISKVGGTASPPALSPEDEGAQLWHLTLNKPIWWDGAAWRDASGAAV